MSFKEWLDEWTREDPRRWGGVAACMAFTGGISGTLLGLPFVSFLAVLTALCLVLFAALFALYLRDRRPR